MVIPAYNEEQRLPVTLPQVLIFAEAQPYPIEVLVVDNASTDRTAQIVREMTTDHPNLFLLHQPIRGKGAAVRKGMMEARGEYLFICDADLAMPIEEVAKFLPPALSGYDIAIASREAPGAVRYNEPWYRHVMGRVFNLIVRWLAVPGIQDTQCGFKCFRRDVARDLFSVQRIDGWAFDVEVLYIALRRGYRIVEVPINWYYGEGSRVHPVRDSINMLREVFRIRRNGRLGVYDTGT
ncbi:MAG TPA: glycosyltransferase family 2 protein [Anaerolineae bacterium]|nr:glycosyltransferase family 2 protein [Anaerolineae bacterium]